jgi:hypothetical protein
VRKSSAALFYIIALLINSVKADENATKYSLQEHYIATISVITSYQIGFTQPLKI